MKEKYPHFRYYLKGNHPALIVGEKADSYNFRGVMHTAKDGKKNNEIVQPNPNRKDKKPMYISRRIKHDKKVFFAKNKLPWKYPKDNKKRSNTRKSH